MSEWQWPWARRKGCEKFAVLSGLLDNDVMFQQQQQKQQQL